MTPKYRSPDFAAIEGRIRSEPVVADARFVPAPADGIAPERFYTTTNFPTYVKVSSAWHLVKHQRMDCAVVLEPATGALVCVEPRMLHQGDMVLAGRARLRPGDVGWKRRICETGEESIYVHTDGFGVGSREEPARDEFAFMTGAISPEYPVDYDSLARLISAHRASVGGFSVWVLGPAVVHSGGREAMQWLVEQGYVGAVFGGNAVATHDIEMSMFNTSLGSGVPGGHRHHLTGLNKVREMGSIRAAIRAGLIRDAIFFACEEHGVPYVLAGSIRDDGPLPEVITDCLIAQTRMRGFAKKATLVITIATVLHSVATGNMTPTFIDRDGELLPVPFVAVDVDAFAIAKLIDRGSLQAVGIQRNADDFLHNVVATLGERENGLELTRSLQSATVQETNRVRV